MREILFRAKDDASKQWVYGYYVHLPSAAGSVHIMHVPAGNPDESNSASYVVPETLGQYTGLTDKNGKKIFEGDILSSNQYPYTSDGKHNYYAEVTWFEENAAFGLYTFKNPQSSVRGVSEGSDYIDEFNSDNWEIIGNIYDSPELFGGDADD